MSIDLSAIRAAIAEEFGDDLGSYTFPNSDSTPAIAIITTDANYPPHGASITGLECVIQLDLGIGIENLLGGAYKKTWRAAIVLKLWDQSGDVLDYLQPLMNAIATLPDIRIQPNSIRGLASERNLDNLQMVQITVFYEEITDNS